MLELKQYTSDELYNSLVDYNLDDPFEKMEILEKEMKYFGDITPHCTSKAEFIFFCVLLDDHIVASSKLKIGGENSFEYDVSEWISFISIREDMKGQGFSTMITEEIFKYLNDNGYKRVIASGYTQSGLDYLRPKFIKEANKYNIELLDKNKVEF